MNLSVVMPTGGVAETTLPRAFRSATLSTPAIARTLHCNMQNSAGMACATWGMRVQCPFAHHSNNVVLCS